MGTKVFDNALDLITFTRASGGTYLDSDGLLKTASTNVPRIEYDASGALKGLLIEEARTNLVTWSEDFTNAAWTKGAVTAAANAAVAPDGTTTADKLTEDASNTPHSVRNVGATISNGNTYTLSAFVKASERAKVSLQAFGASWGGSRRIIVDLSDGSTDSTSGLDAFSVISVGGGWYRVSITATATGTTGSGGLALYIVANSFTLNGFGEPVYQGDGTSGIYVWGAQLEAGAFPTSYIPTAGATATRSADIASIPTSAFGYNQRAGSVVVEVRAEDTASTAGRFFFQLGSGSSYIRLDRFSGNFAFRVFDGTAQVEAAFPGAEPDTTTTYTVAAAYKLNDFAFIRSGSILGTDTSGTVPNGITTANISDGNFNGHIKSIAYYPRRLSNTQLQDLTS